jgi:SAM-dependent methyltransferase
VPVYSVVGALGRVAASGGMADIGALHVDLDFNSPLGAARVDRLVGAAAGLGEATVAEVGCGWGEFLVRVAAAAEGVRAVGIDRDAAAIEHGRERAAERGVADRVELIAGDAARWRPEQPVDVGVCIGSSHVWGGTEAALRRLREVVRPGGWGVFGEGFWAVPPTTAATDALGGDPAEFGTIGELAELAVACGWRVWDLSEASQDEWDAFESGYARGWERWLRDHPDDPEAAQVRQRCDEHRARYLKGYRGVLGFAYLVLA